MPESALQQLTGIGRDAAKRVSDALTRLLRKPVELRLAGASFEPIETVPSYLAAEPGLSVCLLSRVQGDLEGNALLAFSLDAANTWVAYLGGQGLQPSDENARFGAMEQSMLEETANIALSSFMNELAGSLQRKAVPTSPIFLLDMAESIGSVVLMECAESSDHTFLFRVDFRVGGESLAATLAFLPSPASFAELSLG